MTKEEFKKYVIAEAQKYLFSQEEDKTVPTPKIIKEDAKKKEQGKPGIDPLDIKRLAEEIKKINKKIDLRNPLISESGESLGESILKDKSTIIQDREHVDEINKKKHINFQNEGEKDKWNRMLNYNVPDDENRD